MWWAPAAVAVAIAVSYGAHRLLLAADERGWVYYRTKPRLRGSSLGLLESVYHPAMEHVIEERASSRARPATDDSGDDPNEETPDRGLDTPASGRYESPTHPDAEEAAPPRVSRRNPPNRRSTTDGEEPAR